MQAIIGMPLHIIIIGAPLDIILVIISQRSASIVMSVPLIGCIRQIMPSLVISMVQRH